MSFTHPSKPAVMTGQGALEGDDIEDFKYLLMPIRFAGYMTGVTPGTISPVAVLTRQ